MKKIPKTKTNNPFGIGSLAYIPSQTLLMKFDSEKEDVVTDHRTLVEPAVVPIVEINDEPKLMAKVHYKGGLWWASGSDLYEVREDSLGDSLK